MRGGKALRRAIAAEAARLMIHEDVGEYFNAKRQAAENLLGMRATAVTLPSNREIRAAILQLTSLEGVTRDRRLAHMRSVALDLMDRLAAFDPRLIGSVASGAIHAHSDIDLHIFCRSHDQLEHVLRVEGLEAERIERDVSAGGQRRRYVHYQLELEGIPVELSVYEPEELRVVSYSSIDDKPIDRMTRARLARLATEALG